MQVLDDVAVEAALRLDGAFGEEALEEFLEGIRRHFALAQICYAGSLFPGPGREAMVLSLIHGGRSFPFVRDTRLVFLEALLAAYARGAVPLDWAALAKRDPKLRRLRDEARDAGLGRQGLTIPVFGGKRARALFSVTADESDAAWGGRWFELARDLLRIAYFVDRSACGQSAADGQDRIHPGQGDPADFGLREVEAL